MLIHRASAALHVPLMMVVKEASTVVRARGGCCNLKCLLSTNIWAATPVTTKAAPCNIVVLVPSLMFVTCNLSNQIWSSWTQSNVRSEHPGASYEEPINPDLYEETQTQVYEGQESRLPPTRLDNIRPAWGLPPWGSGIIGSSHVCRGELHDASWLLALFCIACNSWVHDHRGVGGIVGDLTPCCPRVLLSMRVFESPRCRTVIQALQPNLRDDMVLKEKEVRLEVAKLFLNLRKLGIP